MSSDAAKTIQTRSILITGVAGFIGFHLAKAFLNQGFTVRGLDSINDYYDPRLKQSRLDMLMMEPQFSFVRGHVESVETMSELLRNNYDMVIHLAAQAGVRYSLSNPDAYIRSNIVGTNTLLQLLKDKPPKHMLFASSSSVYGANLTTPFRESDRTDFPVSLYAATKKAGEAMCHSYAHLYSLPITAMRFFTVYGPWGRPDMALFTFTRAILAGEPIDVFGDGHMRRDFTYIDDLVASILRLIDMPPAASLGPMDSVSPAAPFRTVNLGGGNPIGLMDYIFAIEEAVGMTAEKRFLPMQPGDVVETSSDPDLLTELIGPPPSTSVREGVAKFVEWYRSYYQV
jgi:UDP-glucuronate 4-epimerase